MNYIVDNKRIARNTLFLYFRMFITMGISLYTSRLVLNILGVDDFGIYNVVGGVVAMFSVISGSLSTAITIKAPKFSQSAISKIEDAGGIAEII